VTFNFLTFLSVFESKFISITYLEDNEMAKMPKSNKSRNTSRRYKSDK
jgi:hypothetical protein